MWQSRFWPAPEILQTWVLFLAAAYTNLEYQQDNVVFDPAVQLLVQDLLPDAQTSIGLRVSLEESSARRLAERLRRSNPMCCNRWAGMPYDGVSVRVIPG